MKKVTVAFREFRERTRQPGLHGFGATAPASSRCRPSHSTGSLLKRHFELLAGRQFSAPSQLQPLSATRASPLCILRAPCRSDALGHARRPADNLPFALSAGAMAAFDPIEFFGTGHGRDIAIVRHARDRSQGSISLSSVDSRFHAAAETRQVATFPATEHLLLTGVPPFHSAPAWPSIRSSGATKQPNAASRGAFGHITPEGSLTGLSAGLPDTASAASPNVSISSGSARLLAKATPLERYVSSRHRHEQIALSLPANPAQQDCQSGSSQCDSIDGAARDGAGYYAGSPADIAAAPMHRYLTDVLQAHERLAVALESHDHPHELDATSANQKGERIHAESSISLSDGQSKQEHAGLTLESAMAKLYVGPLAKPTVSLQVLTDDAATD